ncbi:MAG TPA: cytochrome c maturation protein CcmE [Caulobacterales bacterium]|nr:cytochrome c maturation protein CcmE [Caulobacterales bacterium]
MSRRSRRLTIIGVAGALLALAASLVLAGLRDSIVYFYPPTELAAKAKPGQRVKIGGLVEAGSISHDSSGALLFKVTDNRTSTAVRYTGVVPDLFKETKGVIAEGVYQPGAVFEADSVLAKHDENYMPKEVVEALKKRGEWRPDAGPGAGKGPGS